MSSEVQSRGYVRHVFRLYDIDVDGNRHTTRLVAPNGIDPMTLNCGGLFLPSQFNSRAALRASPNDNRLLFVIAKAVAAARAVGVLPALRWLPRPHLQSASQALVRLGLSPSALDELNSAADCFQRHLGDMGPVVLLQRLLGCEML